MANFNSSWVLVDFKEEEETKDNSTVINKTPAVMAPEIVEEKKGNSTVINKTPAIIPPEIISETSNLTRDAADSITSKQAQNCGVVTGFFYQSKPDRKNGYHYYNQIQQLFKPQFVPIESKPGSSLADPCLEFLKQYDKHARIKVIDSCNGLLLCTYTAWKDIILVCNPLTEESVLIPAHGVQGKQFSYALMADSRKKGYFQYKVVCAVTPRQDYKFSKLLIFSSETGEWEKIEGSFPAFGKKLGKVFFNESLVWDCFAGHTHFLICHLNPLLGCCYQLIEAPPAPRGSYFWTLKDKLLCYCHGFQQGIAAWSLSISDERKMKWELEGCENFEVLTLIVVQKYVDKELEYSLMEPKHGIQYTIIAYDHDSNIMYLWRADSIFSYDFAEGKLGWVWSSASISYQLSWPLPYVHSLAHIQIKGERTTKDRAENPSESEEETSEFDDESDETSDSDE